MSFRQPIRLQLPTLTNIWNDISKRTRWIQRSNECLYQTYKPNLNVDYNTIQQKVQALFVCLNLLLLKDFYQHIQNIARSIISESIMLVRLKIDIFGAPLQSTQLPNRYRRYFPIPQSTHSEPNNIHFLNISPCLSTIPLF